MMMKRFLYFLRTCVLVATIVLFATSCRKESEKDEFSANLVVELREAFVKGQRHAGLYVATLEEYPCSNFEISYHYTHAGGVRMIVFEGIPKQEECLAEFGPARAFIDMGVMGEGAHAVTLEIGENSLNTRFQVEDEYLMVDVLNKGAATTLEFQEKTMHRLPQNHVWGYVHPKVPGDDTHYPVFLQKLAEAGAKEKHLQPGNYGFFRVAQDGLYLYDHVYQYMPGRPLVMTFEGEFQMLQDIAMNFRDHCVIALYSAKGHVFHNQ